LWSSITSAEFPSAAQLSYDAFVDRLGKLETRDGLQRVWLAWKEASLVGMAFVLYPDQENLELAVTSIRVARDRRRRGVGSAVLREVMVDAVARGRRIMWGQGLFAGSDGDKWSHALGFAKVEENVRQSLTVSSVDPSLWQVPTPPGFRVETWLNEAPESRVAGYARARTAITDAPPDDSSVDFPEWTVARVREHEAKSRATGGDIRVAVAVHEATDVIAGLTETVTVPSQPEFCYQNDTAVLAEFLGLGLGRCLKAAMMRWLISEQLGIERVMTQTAVDNVHMIRVNHQLGYVTDATMFSVETTVDALREHLA
jgi:GNAT superfamily N-acetyltransferase